MFWQYCFYFNATLIVDCWIHFVVVVIIVIVIFIVASCHSCRHRIAVVIALPSSSCRSQCWCCRLSPPPSSFALATSCWLLHYCFCYFSSPPSPSSASPSRCCHCHCHHITTVPLPSSSWLLSSSSFYLIVVCFSVFCACFVCDFQKKYCSMNWYLWRRHFVLLP